MATRNTAGPMSWRLFRTLGFLLSYNTNVDDRHRSAAYCNKNDAHLIVIKVVDFIGHFQFLSRSMMQDLIRKTLRRQDMGPAVFLVATVWK